MLICRGVWDAVRDVAEGSVDLILSAEASWRLFEATGSIWAYLAYRRVARRFQLVARLSLN